MLVISMPKEREHSLHAHFEEIQNEGIQSEDHLSPDYAGALSPINFLVSNSNSKGSST